MHGVLRWRAGAVRARVLADLLAVLRTGSLAGLSVDALVAESSISGETGDWSAVAGVEVAMAGPVASPVRLLAQLGVSAGGRLQMAAARAVDGAGTALVDVTTAVDVSLPIDASSAGGVRFVATGHVLALAALDWSAFAVVAEVQRGGPLLTAGSLESGAILLTSGGQSYAPRIKSPTAAGVAPNAALTVAAAYPSLATSRGRAEDESLYTPACPLVASYAGYPVGPVGGVLACGGYVQSGDTLTIGAVEYLLLRSYPVGLLVALE